MNTTTIRIRGLTPLLMHNGHLADPLSDASKVLAKLTAKRNKTEADHLAVRKAEWYGGLYVDRDECPCLPGEVIEASLVEGARRFKLGKVAKGGLVVVGNFKIEYNGPRSIDGLWEDGGFIKCAGVKIKQQRVIRSRPMFPAWGCSFDVLWDPLLVKDEDQLVEIAESAGMTGIGDWRPKYGRFEVV